MISFATFCKGAQEVSFGSSTTPNWALGRMVLATATAPSLGLLMPVATGLPLGTDHALILNVGSNDFWVTDKDGVGIKQIVVGKAAMVGLADNSTAAGTWSAVLLAIAT